MELRELEPRPHLNQQKKLQSAFSQFEALIAELRKQPLPEEMATSINTRIDKVNAASVDKLKATLKESQTNILTLIEKELKLVPKNHYRNLWLAVGMAAFGLPIGLAFGTSLGNMGFLGLGLPIGMAIGIAIGAGKDKQALKEGRQLDVEIKR